MSSTKVIPFRSPRNAAETRPEIPDAVLLDMADGATDAAIADLSADDRDELLRAMPALCGELLRRRIAMRTGIA